MIRAVVLVVGVALGSTACGGSSSANAPAGHTVNEAGVMHKPGLQNPTANCVSCHGADLQGGQGPSCFSCHGQMW